jgi:hypothetical protein
MATGAIETSVQRGVQGQRQVLAGQPVPVRVSSLGNRPLVASTTCSRRPGRAASQRPMISSERPSAYTSAESTSVPPASAAASRVVGRAEQAGHAGPRGASGRYQVRATRACCRRCGRRSPVGLRDITLFIIVQSHCPHHFTRLTVHLSGAFCYREFGVKSAYPARNWGLDFPDKCHLTGGYPIAPGRLGIRGGTW